MPHVPERSQDLLGQRAMRDAIVFTAHENYPVDGIDLNKLACLALRLDHEIPMDADEKRLWGDILLELIGDAKRHGPTGWKT